MTNSTPNRYHGKRVPPEQYHQIAHERGIIWLGPYIDVRAKTRWRCPKGHEWEAPYYSIQAGTACPVCRYDTVGRKKRHGDMFYYDLAAANNLVWLGPLPRSVDHKTRWRCPAGHEWEAIGTNIRKGSGCPVCAHQANGFKKRITPQGYHNMAALRGLRWLGPEAASVDVLSKWQCKSGHEWLASYSNIKAGYGCPRCVDMENGVKVSGIQRQLCDILDGQLNVSVGRYRIDVAIERNGTRIAIEYDGYYWHRKANNDKQREVKRDNHFIKAGWKVLHIRSGNLLPSTEQLRDAIQKLCNGSDFQEIILEDWGE